MGDQPFNFHASVNEAIENALKSRGVANILIAGKTGVGKSTLINSVFQGRMAETGQGRPVTQETRLIEKAGVPVRIYDTKGLEIKDYKPILASLMDLVKTQNKSTNAQEHIHAAWLCIAEGSRRVEEAEISLMKELSALIPVIVVITTAVSDNGFKKTVEDLLPEARNVVRVNSLPHALDEGVEIPARGLDTLVELTMEVIPEAQKNAFAAAQRIVMTQKISRAHKVVAASAAAAATAAAAPIPFSDAIAIVPIQVGMLAGVSACFGLELTTTFLGTIVSGTFTSVAATMAGRAIVGALLKFIPGGGSLVGGAISATVATSVTVAFGEAYIATLVALLKGDPDKHLSAQEIAEAFKKKIDDQEG